MSTKRTGDVMNTDQAIQAIVDDVIGNDWVYGPLSSRWDPERGAIACRANWARNRRPKHGNPPNAAACSTLVWAVLSSLRGAGEAYDSRGGRSVAKRLRGREAEWLPEWASEGGKRNSVWCRRWDWGDMVPRVRSEGEPETTRCHLTFPVNVVFYRGHVVLALDCDAISLTDPRTGKRCDGVWCLASDGSFWDRFLGGRLTRTYSCRPMRFEPAHVRAKREANRPDRRRKVAVVPINLEGCVPVPIVGADSEAA